jgi:hypothetical protein
MTARFFRAAGTGGAIRRCLRGRFDFVEIADRVRMPWRFLARHMAVDGNLGCR